jgi:hypothetical protein
MDGSLSVDPSNHQYHHLSILEGPDNHQPCFGPSGLARSIVAAEQHPVSLTADQFLVELGRELRVHLAERDLGRTARAPAGAGADLRKAGAFAVN